MSKRNARVAETTRPHDRNRRVSFESVPCTYCSERGGTKKAISNNFYELIRGEPLLARPVPGRELEFPTERLMDSLFWGAYFFGDRRIFEGRPTPLIVRTRI